jgi:hypothetical protein
MAKARLVAHLRTDHDSATAGIRNHVFSNSGSSGCSAQASLSRNIRSCLRNWRRWATKTRWMSSSPLSNCPLSRITPESWCAAALCGVLWNWSKAEPTACLQRSWLSWPMIRMSSTSRRTMKLRALCNSPSRRSTPTLLFQHGYDGSAVGVAIIDSGIMTHSDLGSRIVYN